LLSINSYEYDSNNNRGRSGLHFCGDSTKKAPYWSLGQGLGDFSSFLKFSLGEAAAQ
jgi:hypothetical protein